MDGVNSVFLKVKVILNRAGFACKFPENIDINGKGYPNSSVNEMMSVKEIQENVRVVGSIRLTASVVECGFFIRRLHNDGWSCNENVPGKI